YNVCWQINSSDQDSLVMYIDSNTHYNADPVWFSLGNPIGVTVDSEATTTSTEMEATTAPTLSATSSAIAGTSGGSRTDPAPVGETAQVGDYEVSVESVEPSSPDAYSASAYLEPAPEGQQFFLANIPVTYTGSGSGNPATDLDINAVGSQSKSYSAAMN